MADERPSSPLLNKSNKTSSNNKAELNELRQKISQFESENSKLKTDLKHSNERNEVKEQKKHSFLFIFLFLQIRLCFQRQ